MAFNLTHVPVIKLLAKRPPDEDNHQPDWEARISCLMEHTSAAYALVIMTKDALFGVRDPYGFRPLCIGQIPPPVLFLITVALVDRPNLTHAIAVTR